MDRTLQARWCVVIRRRAVLLRGVFLDIILLSNFLRGASHVAVGRKDEKWQRAIRETRKSA